MALKETLEELVLCDGAVEVGCCPQRVGDQNRTRAARNARPHDTQDTRWQALLSFHAHLQSPLCQSL